MNVLGYVYPTKALLPAMMENNEGRIVFVSSQAGQVCYLNNVLVYRIYTYIHVLLYSSTYLLECSFCYSE